MPEIRITIAVEEPRRYTEPEGLYSKSVVLSEELAGLYDVREAIAKSTVKMIEEALASFRVPAETPDDAPPSTMGYRVREWLAEDDRLRWAIARLRGHEGGPTSADEEEASELLAKLDPGATTNADLEALPF